MKKYINTSNYYLSTTTSTIASSSSKTWYFDVADITVDGVTLPLEGYYWVDVDFGDVSKREIFRIDRREGYRLFYDDRISPNWAVAHTSWASVGLRDFSQLLNSLSTNTDNFWEIEKVWDLEIIVRGGVVYHTSNMNAKTGKITISDTTFDNTYISTNSELYVVLEYDEIEWWHFAVKTELLLEAEWQYPIAKIVTWATNISEIVDLRATTIGCGNMRKEVYDPDWLAEWQTIKDVFDMDNMKQSTDLQHQFVTQSQIDLRDSYQTTKQDLLISWTNIKTINNTSVLGNWNIDTNQVSDDSYSDSWDWVENVAPSKNAVYDKLSSMDTTIAWKQDELTAGANIQINWTTISATDTTYTASDFDIKDLADSTALRNKWDNKQNALVAGANIQINWNTISSTNTTYTAGTWIGLTWTQINNTWVLSVNWDSWAVTVDEFVPWNTGSVWQVLKKTASWYEWDSESDAVTSVNWQTGAVTVEEFIPWNEWETWQVLKKTSTWYSWWNESWGWGWDYTAWDGINISLQNEISNTWVLSVNWDTWAVTIDSIGSSNDTYDNIIHLSQSAYDALAVKDPDTLYSTPEWTEWDAFAPGNTWTAWQVLTKTANSYQWSDAPVASVNWQTGAVSLSIPTNTSDLNNDSWYVTNQVSDAAYSNDWNGDTTNAPSKNAVYDKINTMPTYAEFAINTATSWATLAISHLTTSFVPTEDFTINCWTVKEGMQYIVRVDSWATAYNITLWASITNPFNEDLTLTASKMTTMVFLATSSSTLELFSIRTAE